MEYLKNTYCPIIEIPSVIMCRSNVEKLLPQQYLREFSKALDSSLGESINGFEEVVDKGFNQVLVMSHQNIEVSCASYGSSALTFNYTEFEKLKSISTKLK